MFFHLSVSHSVHRGAYTSWTHPLVTHTPLDIPPGPPTWTYTHPGHTNTYTYTLDTYSHRTHTPSPPLWTPPSPLWSTSSQYASYLNSFLLPVIFLHLFVILFTGGGSASVHAGIPPGSRQPPPEQTSPTEQTPPREQAQSRPPESRHLPAANTPLAADTLPLEQTPPQEQTPPPKQTPAYGLRAAGTHPTGMHSCSHVKTVEFSVFDLNLLNIL